jgi:hypothetical protein
MASLSGPESADRVLFATDYPFVFAPGGGARRFIDEATLTEAERAGIASRN